MPDRDKFPPDVKPPGRLAYLRLHADSLLLILLAFFSGGLNLIHPSHSQLAQDLGRVPASLLGWSAILLLGGLLLMIGVTWRLIKIELIARLFIVVSVLWSTYAEARVYGVTSENAVTSYITMLIVVVTSGLRVSALLHHGDLYVIYPGRKIVEDPRL